MGALALAGGLLVSVRGADAPAADALAMDAPVPGTVATPIPPGPPLAKDSITIRVTNVPGKGPSEQEGALFVNGKAGIRFVDGSDQTKPGEDLQNLSQTIGEKNGHVYTIAIRNAGSIPAHNLAVEYHFYALGKKSVRVPLIDRQPEKELPVEGPVITETAATKQVSVDPGQSVDVVPPQIFAHTEISVYDGYTPKYYENHPEIIDIHQRFFSRVTTDFLGWRVEVRYNGAVIAHADDPPGLNRRLEQVNQEIAQNEQKRQALLKKEAEQKKLLPTPVRDLDTSAPGDAPGPALPKNSISLHVNKTAVKLFSANSFPELNSDLDAVVRRYGSTEGMAAYVITVGNTAKIPVKNLKLEYHFYNRVAKTIRDVVQPPQVVDISAVKYVDVAAQKSTDVPVARIPVGSSTRDEMYTSRYYRSKSLPLPQGDPPLLHSSLDNQFIGWSVDVSYHGAIVAHGQDPANLQAKLDEASRPVAAK